MSIPKVAPGGVVELFFETFAGSTGAPVTLSGLAVGDIKVYKNGSTTERASTSGYTLLDTDGTDFDGITGIHGVSIDTSDNTTAGFFVAGGRYEVVVSTVTVDSQTMSFRLGRFRIGHEGAILDTTIATLASQTSFTLTAGPTNDSALRGCRVIVSSPTGANMEAAYVSAYTGSTKAVTLAYDPGAYTMAAGDNISILPPNLADVVAISSDTAAADNLEAASDGTGYNLGGGSIVAASVTGAVGSVTGAVGSVTGNVGGNVAGSVGSVTGNVGGNVTGSVGSVASGIPTTAAIADAVWDEATSGHQTAGTTGKALSDAGGGGGGSVTVNLLYSGEYTLQAEDQFPSGMVDLFVGSTPRLYLHLRNSQGGRINLSAHTVEATLTDRTGTVVSAVSCTAESTVLGIVYVDVPSAWTSAARQGAQMTATLDGASTITCGPLPVTVRAL